MGHFDEEDHNLFSWIGQRLNGFARPKMTSRAYTLLYYVVFTVSPDVPRHVWINFHEPRIGRTILTASSVALLFTFGFTVFVTFLSNTLFRDTDPSTVQFLEDWVNIALYILICPLYVGLSCAMIGVATQYWSRPILASDDQRVVRPRASRWRGIVAIGIVLFGASWSISQYQYDLLTNPSFDKHYWFIASVGDVDMLNRAGFYYIILNFGLLCVAAFGALAYCSLAVQAVRDARGLATSSCDDSETVIERFRDFKAAILIGRLLVACYMLNTLLWYYSPLGQVTLINVLLTTSLIVVVGVVGTTSPDYYVMAQLNGWRQRCIAQGTEASSLSLVPHIPRPLLFAANSVLYVIGLGFLVIMFPVLDSGDHIRGALRWFGGT